MCPSEKHRPPMTFYQFPRFSMDSLWFSIFHDVPLIFHDVPVIFLWVPMTFLLIFHDVPVIFLWVPMTFHWFSMTFQWFSEVPFLSPFKGSSKHLHLFGSGIHLQNLPLGRWWSRNILEVNTSTRRVYGSIRSCTPNKNIIYIYVRVCVQLHIYYK